MVAEHAGAQDKNVLHLPPYHSDLKPIVSVANGQGHYPCLNKEFMPVYQ